MRLFNRREFLQDSAALAATLAGAGLLDHAARAEESKTAKKADVNDQLRVAVIGVNGRGMSHIDAFAGNDKLNTIVATVCDCDGGVIGSAMKHVENAQGKAPKFEQDLRKVLEDKSIDIITIATPNHWHALAAIWAIQHGKDVYVEKPVSHNVSEGRRIVEAARKYNRICQTGTQSRSSTGLKDAMEFLHTGKLGNVKLARGLCYKLRPSIGKVDKPTEPPKSCNYDLWCGPAPMKPLMRKRLHYDWHWVWDTGNGDLGNQGIHEMDKARWGLGKDGLPNSVVSVGGRFGYIDDGETPNTQICLFDYGDCELIFEVRGLPSVSPYPGKDYGKKPMKPQGFVGNIFYGTEGVLVVPSYTHATALNKSGEVIKEFKGSENHFGNFIKAVRSRKMSDLNADILEGHLSSALCHLGNVSYRLGTLAPFSNDSKAFGDDKEAYETFARMQEHLKDNKVALETTDYRVGRKLKIDPKTERFIGDTEADAMLTREHRKGFVVPEKV
jgi:predicted dehydrogenase